MGVRVARQGESTFEEEFELVSTTEDILSFRLHGVMRINDDSDDFDTICLK